MTEILYFSDDGRENIRAFCFDILSVTRHERSARLRRMAFQRVFQVFRQIRFSADERPGLARHSRLYLRQRNISAQRHGADGASRT